MFQQTNIFKRDFYLHTPAGTHADVHPQTVFSLLSQSYILSLKSVHLSVFISSSFTICWFPLSLYPPLCLAQWRGEDGGNGGGREEDVFGVCVCVGGAFENSPSIAAVLWWSREWYREIMKRRTKALSSRCDWYPPLLLPSSLPVSHTHPPFIPLFSPHFPSVSPSTSNGVSLSLSLHRLSPPLPLPFLPLSSLPVLIYMALMHREGGVFVNNKKVRF